VSRSPGSHRLATRRALWAALAVTATLAALPATASADFVTFEAASNDGSRVFFRTDARLVAADTDNSVDIYQRSGGATTLISTGPNGGNGAHNAFFEGASQDGSRVFFTTDEQLVTTGTPADTDSSTDIYERSAGVTTLISTGPDGGNGAHTALFEGASADGSRVFFDTSEKLVTGGTPADGDTQADVYQRSAGVTTLISTGPNGGNGANDATFAGASSDGSRVFFTTAEKLVTTGTPADTDSSGDVYERSGSTTTLISVGPNGGNGANPAFFTHASSDGSRVLFTTAEQLVTTGTPKDTDSQLDIYQRAAGATTLISTGPNGGNGGNEAFFRGASADGSRVFFTTDESLTTTDGDTSVDVYQRAAGATTLISTGPNGGNGANNVSFDGASEDGSRVFFETTEKLVTAADTDSSLDVYQRQGHVVTLISTGPDGGNGANGASFRGASADGSRVFFLTDERLVTAADRDSSFDVYQRSGTATTLISTGPSGGNGANDASFGGASADGSRVFFETFEKLVTPADADGDNDVYQRSGSITTLVSIAGDTDSDGVLDPSDNCALVSNVTQADADGDGQGDACDADDDNDGIADGSDNCALVANPGQEDTDIDGQGDACDGDTDGDGVADVSDNCALVSNAAQTNTDGDAQGDACDPDDDNDGVADTSDNCPVNSNAAQTNSDLTGGGNACDPDDDNDGLTDFAEALRHTKPLDQDSDDDGISDAREVNVTKTKPLKFDSDGDGISDGVELGLVKGIADPPGAIVATNPAKFRKDLAPKTKTKPLKADTDGDGLKDGAEDKNHNGRKDAGETSPLKKDTDGDGFNDKVDKKPLNKNQH
jgi:hypothetical protein